LGGRWHAGRHWRPASDGGRRSVDGAEAGTVDADGVGAGGKASGGRRQVGFRWWQGFGAWTATGQMVGVARREAAAWRAVAAAAQRLVAAASFQSSQKFFEVR
jgi:hypothetical protein